MPESEIRKVVVVQSSAEGFKNFSDRLNEEYGNHWPEAILLIRDFKHLAGEVENGATLVAAGTLQGDPSGAVEYLKAAKNASPDLVVVAYAYRDDLPGFESVADHLCEKKSGRRGDNLPHLLRQYLESGKFELPA